MKRWEKSRIAVLMMVILCALAGCAAAETARELTSECEFTPGSAMKNFEKATDGDYATRWQSAGGKKAYFEVRVPDGEEAGGIWFQWYDHEHMAAVEIQDENGEWVECGRTEGAYLSEYVALPKGTTYFRVANPKDAKRSTPIVLAEVHVYSAGEMPPEVQVWQAPCEKADLLLIATHPDDELLWFGGVLPYYAGVEHKNVQVCIMVPTVPRRRLEELDGLWTCGVRNYPAFGYFRDSFSNTKAEQYKKWDKYAVLKLVTKWFRRFKPDVVVTHDINGEYGHGGHRVCADAVIQALEISNNEKKYPELYEEYGGWDVPKCYIHLYSENVIQFDWRVPLEEFGGQTALDVARAAFACHISQQHTNYSVEDSGPCDCRLFGLYRSLVGDDQEHNDFFENLSGIVKDEDE